MKKLILFSLLTWIAFNSNAITYYISTAANGGNNANSGAIGSPWLTLAYACSQVTTSGDIIYVNAGTFIETSQCVVAVSVSLDGTGVTSIIKAGYTSDTNPLNSFILLASSSEGTDGNQHISNLKIDGNAQTGRYGIYVAARSNVSIHDCTIVDVSTRGVTWNGMVTNTDGPPSVYATGNQFYNNIMTNSSTANLSTLMIGGQDGMLIHDNNLTQHKERVIGFWNLGFLKGVKIYNNTITKDPFNGTGYDFAVELWNISGLEMYNNTITGDVDLNWLSKGAYAYSVDFHNNTVGPASQQANVEHGVTLEEGCSDVIVRNNLIKNVEVGIQIQVNSVHGPTTYNNLSFYSNIFDGMGKTTGTSGTCLNWNGNGTGTVNNINIWNNTAYGRYSTATDGFRIDGVCATTNVSIRNNIVVGFVRCPVHMYMNNAGSTIDIVSIEHNDFYGNGNSNVYLAQSITPTNVTNQNNITTNPLLVSTSDFSLQSGSPAINAGLNVGLLTDYRGYHLVGTSDIGAYEYGATGVKKGISTGTGAWGKDGVAYGY